MPRTPHSGAARRIGVGLIAALALGAATLLSAAPMALADPVASPSSSPTPGPDPTGSPSPSIPSATPTPPHKPSPTPAPTDTPVPSPTAPPPTDSPTPDPSTGTVTGTLTDSAGAPLASSSITIQATEDFHVYSVGTDARGHYTIQQVQPGTYRMNFMIPGTSLIQYVPQQTDSFAATPFTVTAGQTTTVNDAALPTGTITGHFRDRDGSPVSAQVYARTATGAFTSAFGNTDDAGAFSLPVFTGTYLVQFTYGGGAYQYAYQQTDQSRAQQFPVGSGATVVVDDTPLPSGSVSGRLTDNDGGPAAGAYVSLTENVSGQFLQATTAADGTYRFDRVLVGSYTAQFYSADFQRKQWAYHTTDQGKAAAITVTEGQNTTIDDTFVATGSLAVTATDGGTGQPVADFCVYVWNGGADRGQCSDGTGTVNMTGLPEGDTYLVDVSVPDDLHRQTTLTNVAIVAGQTTTRAAVIRPAAVIETTVLDARSHQPVANVCVSAVAANGGAYAGNSGYCTDDQGKVRMGYLEPGTYRLFAGPSDGVHGAQWLGASGGTGNPALAKRVSAPAGAETVAPTIYLDPAGSISGTVRDKATGAPVASVCVSATAVSAAWYHTGECPGGETDANGRYTITGLGPYAWPVEFASLDTYAWEWSGGAANRLEAKLIKVTTGKTATADARLSRGTTVKGRVLDTAGKPVEAYVVVVNALTGEAVGPWADALTGSYEVPVLPQAVRIQYTRMVSPLNQWYWYRDATDFDHATPVLVGSKSRTIDLVVPAS